MEEVILVNEKDEPVGTMEKLEAHRKGILHRAFSILIYNSKGQLLLQRRATHKYHSQGLWSNTCCSHPRPGESLLMAAARRLKEEMGIEASLEITANFIYKTELPCNIIENEYDYVIKGITDVTPMINKDEVADFKYIDIGELKADIEKHRELYTFWFYEIVRRELI